MKSTKIKPTTTDITIYNIHNYEPSELDRYINGLPELVMLNIKLNGIERL